MPSSIRKENIRRHFDGLSGSRDFWIERNRDYYDDDRKYSQFLIPARARVLEREVLWFDPSRRFGSRHD